MINYFGFITSRRDKLFIEKGKRRNPSVSPLKRGEREKAREDFKT